MFAGYIDPYRCNKYPGDLFFGLMGMNVYVKQNPGRGRQIANDDGFIGHYVLPPCRLKSCRFLDVALTSPEFSDQVPFQVGEWEEPLVCIFMAGADS